MAVPPVAPEVLSAARDGDPVATEQVLRTHQPTMYALCRRILGDDADAADATQEAMIAVVRGLPRFDGRSALSTWIHRVTTNAALDEVRRRRRRPMLDHELGSDGDHDRRPPGTASIDDAIADRLRLDAALDALSSDFRVPVVLRDVLGLDYAEIAEVLDLAPGTVRSRISRGRAALARSLDVATGNQAATDDVRTSDAP